MLNAQRRTIAMLTLRSERISSCVNGLTITMHVTIAMKHWCAIVAVPNPALLLKTRIGNHRGTGFSWSQASTALTQGLHNPHPRSPTAFDIISRPVTSFRRWRVLPTTSITRMLTATVPTPRRVIRHLISSFAMIQPKPTLLARKDLNERRKLLTARFEILLGSLLPHSFLYSVFSVHSLSSDGSHSLPRARSLYTYTNKAGPGVNAEPV